MINLQGFRYPEYTHYVYYMLVKSCLKKMSPDVKEAYESRIIESIDETVSIGKDDGLYKKVSRKNKEITLVKDETQGTLAHLEEYFKDITTDKVTGMYSKYCGDEESVKLNMTSIIMSEFIKKSNTCPYCNRNYIFADDRLIGCRNHVQFDHIRDKSSYPLSQVSLYNLIPACPGCNHAKHNKKDCLDLFKQKLKGEFKIKTENSSINSIFERGQHFPEYYTEDPATEKHIAALQINELYKSHYKDVENLERKFEKYFTRSSIKEYIAMGVDEATIVSDILGVQEDESKYHLKPLSLMKHDIFKELEKQKNEGE